LWNLKSRGETKQKEQIMSETKTANTAELARLWWRSLSINEGKALIAEHKAVAVDGWPLGSWLVEMYLASNLAGWTPIPGPWQLAHADRERCRVDIETVERGNDLPDQGNHIAVAYWGTPTENATAKLIAAAPELLAACKGCEHELAAYYHWQMQTNPQFAGSQGDIATLSKLHQARAAIAKAEVQS
jgi:hypothetical protein